MITRKLHISEIDNASFIQERCRQYSYAFRLMFKMFDESSDPEFAERFMQRFGLKDIDYRSLQSQVKARKDSESTQKKKIEERISEFEDALANDSKLTDFKRYKIHRKIARLRKSLENNLVFGGRNLLTKITKEYNKGDNKDEAKLSKLIETFREKRVMPFYCTGEANKKGNRFFDLSAIAEGKVVYKPQKGTKVNIAFKLPKKFQDEIVRLQGMAMSKEIAVSVSLRTEWLYLMFDEEKLNGFAIDEVSRRYDVKLLKGKGLPKDMEKEEIKSIYREYYRKQEEVKLAGKIEKRCLVIDLNPTNIGYSVLDRTDDGECRVVSCGLIDISSLCRRLNSSSSSKVQKWQNNKRRYELTMIVKRLFTLAKHYRCSKFIIEDLELGLSEETDYSTREFRRKVNNLWNRSLLESVITRRCNETGIELIKVNPAYTSFIGNMRHPYADATNASIEIGRRGLHRYTKGAFYPSMDVGSLSTVEAEKFGADASGETCSSWVELRKSLQSRCQDKVDFEHRLRTALEDLPSESYSRFSMFSYNSKVICITFNKL